MGLAPFLTQADLELSMGGVNVVAQYLCDDGGGMPDPVIVADVIDQATQRGAGALRSAWEAQEIVALVTADSAVRGAFRAIACGYAGARRPQIRDERGRTMWFDERERAISYLEEIAEAHKRSIAEGQGTAPVNPLTQPTTNWTPKNAHFEFAHTSYNEGDRRRGGF